MKKHFKQKLLIILPTLLVPLTVFSEEILEKDWILHFDQPKSPLLSLTFKHKDELKPAANDFHIVEVSYLSSNIGERWAVVTFDNSSPGQRFLKNEVIVAIFADGTQAYALNLNETLKGNERITKAVHFGKHQFPIVSVTVK